MDRSTEVYASRNPRRTGMSWVYGNQSRSQSPRNHRRTPKHRHRTQASRKGNQTPAEGGSAPQRRELRSIGGCVPQRRRTSFYKRVKGSAPHKNRGSPAVGINQRSSERRNERARVNIDGRVEATATQLRPKPKTQNPKHPRRLFLPTVDSYGPRRLFLPTVDSYGGCGRS